MGEDSGRGVTRGERSAGRPQENDIRRADRQPNSNGLFVGVIAALVLLGLAYLVFGPASRQANQAPAAPAASSAPASSSNAG